MEPVFLVLQAETCEDEGGLWTAATPFKTSDEAIKFVEHVIRDEWHVMTDVDSEPKPLADRRGYKYPEDSSIKRSQVYYDEDGTEAWATLDSGGAMRIKIVKMEEEGKRVC